MGRLPKGFTAKKRGKDEAGETAAQPLPAAQPSTEQPHEQYQDPVQNKGEHQEPKSRSQPTADGSDYDERTGPETRGQVIQRHKREMQAFKKILQRMGKKSKDELAALNDEIEERHRRELQEVEQREKQAENFSQALSDLQLVGSETAAPQGQSTGNGEEHAGAASAGGGQKATKAMKRREKAQREEAEREARIAAEAAAAGPSARAMEEEALGQLLAPLGLRMREIKADGHCLYRSLEDQLSLAARKHTSPQASSSSGDGPELLQYQQLREAVAAHIRAHADDYLPYIPEEDHAAAGKDEGGLSPVERYCRELESTACWGGQLELSVLAQVLKRPIDVYAAGLPTVTLGEEFKSQSAPLQVCYLRHAFGLGEHYNSLGPLEEGTPC